MLSSFSDLCCIHTYVCVTGTGVFDVARYLFSLSFVSRRHPFVRSQFCARCLYDPSIRLRFFVPINRFFSVPPLLIFLDVCGWVMRCNDPSDLSRIPLTRSLARSSHPDLSFFRPVRSSFAVCSKLMGLPACCFVENALCDRIHLHPKPKWQPPRTVKHQLWTNTHTMI